VADHRSRRQKLLAVINPRSGATDGERANAQAALDRVDAKRPAGTLSREDILVSPSQEQAQDLFDRAVDYVARKYKVDPEDLRAADEYFRRGGHSCTDPEHQEGWHFHGMTRVHKNPPRYREGQKVRSNFRGVKST